MNNTKERYQEIQATAMKIVLETSITAYDDLSHPAKLSKFYQMWDDLRTETGCHRDTAKRHIAKALRRQRHPNWTPEAETNWGGFRPTNSGGRPKKAGAAQ